MFYKEKSDQSDAEHSSRPFFVLIAYPSHSLKMLRDGKGREVLTTEDLYTPCANTQR